MTDIKTQWQHPINTKELREPNDSWKLLQYEMKHPEATPKQCAKELNMDPTRVHDVRHKYHHKTRLESFHQYQLEQLLPTLLNETATRIARSRKKAEKREIITNNHISIVGSYQKPIHDHRENNTEPSKELTDNYKDYYKIMQDDTKIENESLDKFVKAVETLTQKDNNNNDTGIDGATIFLKALADNREENYDNTD